MSIREHSYEPAGFTDRHADKKHRNLNANRNATFFGYGQHTEWSKHQITQSLWAQRLK
jgi:hypothetical protein